MKLRCTNCGKAAETVRGNYMFRESGLSNVLLKDIQLIKCGYCRNEEPIIPRLKEVMRTVALGVVQKPFALKGEEIRFLRKYLGMRGESFASQLRTDKTTLSKWETGAQRVSPRTDLLIRTIALGMGAGLRPKFEEFIRDSYKISEEQRDLRIELDPQLNFEYAHHIRGER